MQHQRLMMHLLTIDCRKYGRIQYFQIKQIFNFVFNMRAIFTYDSGFQIIKKIVSFENQNR
jgi:hypothetical protein